MRTVAAVFTAGQPRPEPKIARVLAGLIAGPLTSRQLELAPYYDHCANATVSDLKKLRTKIESERVQILGFGGTPTWIARYSIAPEGRDFALELLRTMRARRGV